MATINMKPTNINVITDEFRPDVSSPEKSLFLCVILQALLDATKPEYAGEPKNVMIERDRAKAWFFARMVQQHRTLKKCATIQE